jgi:hypothetical protein
MASVFAVLACSRRVEIENAPDAGDVTVNEPPPRPDGGVPVVTGARFDHPDGVACPDRPVESSCQGANDFPCNFEGWLENVAEVCQRRTQCTDGWLEVEVGAEGCPTELRMEDPDPPYVECVTDMLSRYRCPCKNVASARFLGLDHGECKLSCGVGELRCPPGFACQAGECVIDAGSSGGIAGG